MSGALFWLGAPPPPLEVDAAVGRALRCWRSLGGWIQEDIAADMRAAGFGTWSRATVSEIERGNRNVTCGELVALAAIFGERPETLLAGEFTLCAPFRPR